MEIVDKFVDFKKYCPTCKYEKTEAWDEPCDECLTNATNEYTEKPIHWEEKEE